jgi:hypothetical protein
VAQSHQSTSGVVLPYIEAAKALGVDCRLMGTCRQLHLVVAEVVAKLGA